MTCFVAKCKNGKENYLKSENFADFDFVEKIFEATFFETEKECERFIIYFVLSDDFDSALQNGSADYIPVKVKIEVED